MVTGGSRIDGGNHQRQTSYQVRRIIQSLREIVGNHSDADIYAVLKESNMDPNETAQKLLNQDPFHVVKRKRDNKKELTGSRGFSDTRRHVEYNIQPAKPPATWNRNVLRGDFHRTTLPGVGFNHEVRIVREYRVKQNTNRDVKLDYVEGSASGKEQAKLNLLDTSSAGICADQTHLAASSVEGPILVNQPCDSAPDHSEGADLISTYPPLLQKTHAPAATLNSEVQREGQETPKAHSSLGLSNSDVGVYSSASDPVHVPSPASRSAGSVGAIRREVGVVGVRKQPLHQPATNSAISNSSFSVPLLAKHTSSTAESFGQSNGTRNRVVASDHGTTSIPTTRASSVSQHNNKTHQQPTGHQKAIQSTMEWKPKSSKTTIISPIMSAPLASSYADSVSCSNPLDVPSLSEKLSHVSISEERHVIIPQHFRVPESDYRQLTFGSFGAGFDSTKGFSAAFKFGNADQLSDDLSVSMSASAPVSSNGNTPADEPVDLSACQATSFRSDSPVSDVEPEHLSSGNSESLNDQDVENYADIGLVQSHSSPYSSPQTQQRKTPSLPSFLAYDPQTSYDVPLLRTVMEDNVHGQGLASPSEAASLHATNSIPSLTVAFSLQQQQSMQQQQPVTNLYPQVHFSHFPNFVPYRQVFSPVYLPQMAMGNYSNNPAYPHPSNGSSYLLMPGGSSHVAGGGIKYAASQYKPVPAGNPTGYGNYTNPTGFTINTPCSVGSATGLDDVGRIKYKDNNLYIPNPQVETSDIWIQTPRELPNLQAAPYYNISGQPPHAAAFMPAAHSSFDAAAAQSSHLQYPGLYHPSPSPATPHHLLHQSGLGGVGVVAAPPGPQIGAAYQQPRLGHVNWPANF